MKNYYNIIIPFITISVMLLSSCQEEDPCPRCFEDIVTCKVNGKEWRSNCISNDPLFGCRAVTCYYYYKEGAGLDLNSTSDLENITFSIGKASIDGGAKIGINQLNANRILIHDHDLIGNCIQYRGDTSIENNIELTLIDTINYIIEGKFQCGGINTCGDTIILTNGYFKTKFIF